MGGGEVHPRFGDFEHSFCSVTPTANASIVIIRSEAHLFPGPGVSSFFTHLFTQIDI